MLYKNILVAIDESETSQRALNEAMMIAKASPDSSLHVLHIVDTFFVNWNSQPLYSKELENTVIETGKMLLKNVEAELDKAKILHFKTELISLESTSHRVDDKIIEIAKKWPADLIVIGTHGRKGLHRFLLGSVAEGVIRTSTLPVLSVRGKD